MVTGHRPNNLGGAYALSDALNQRLGHEMRDFILRHGEKAEKVELIQGGALGADTIFALVGLKLKTQFPGKYTLETAVPCKNQDSKWNKTAKQIYEGIIAASDKITAVTNGDYTQGCMEKRNHYMVNQMTENDRILAIWTGATGGTYECICYALSKGHNVYVINPMDNWKKGVLTPNDKERILSIGGAQVQTKYSSSALINPNEVLKLANREGNKQHILEINTSTIRYAGPGRLDISRKSGDAVFAPTWDMVNGYKACLINTQEYTTEYYELMRQSYKNNFKRWMEVLSMNSVTLCCYCPPTEFCHRHLLVDILTKVASRHGVKVEYKGEI